MTIYEDTFVSIRDENPDIDSEIRGILVARAQTGATISEIRDDYRKITGLHFPVYKNVTDFLLCIPGITAYCNENGTRIFNVVPTDKNQHIYNFVMNQKSADNVFKSNTYKNFNNKHYNNNSSCISNKNNRNHENINVNLQSRLQQLQTQNQRISEQNHFTQPAQQNFEKPDAHYGEHIGESHDEDIEDRQLVICEESDGVATTTTENNCYYEDNYNYIYGRILTQKASNAVNAVDDANNNVSNYNVARLNCERRDRRKSIQPTYLRRNYNNSRPLRLTPKQNHRIFTSSSPTCTRTNTSFESFTTDSDYVAHLLDFVLLGDDFLLYLARMELNCKFKKYEKVLQSGLCVSGQTIQAATKRIRRMFDFSEKSVIVNIGSVDIMKGKPLVQIEHDFRELIDTLIRKGFRPILTTLAPIANHSYDADMKARVERFNEFIKREGKNLQVIDIFSQFVNVRNQTFFDCYQKAPRSVTGTEESYVFWNKIGRQRVLKKIESELEY